MVVDAVVGNIQWCVMLDVMVRRRRKEVMNIRLYLLGKRVRVAPVCVRASACVYVCEPVCAPVCESG